MVPTSSEIRPSVWIWPISSSVCATSTDSASATTSWIMKPTATSTTAAR